MFNQSEFKQELTGNILPFWIKHSFDRINGGFYGALSNDRQIHNEIPRASTLCARILWSFAAAYRRFGNAEYLASADYAYHYLRDVFLDPEYGGMYWDVDYQGKPVMDRKHHYAQAFAIYGLSEYFQASGNPDSLKLAQELFRLLEKHAYDPENQGYIEGSSCEWATLEDMRLSPKDLNCRKSMNTMLHILEAYISLVKIWDDPFLKEQFKHLLEVFLSRIIDPQTGHFKLFFNDRWQSLSENISFGHDIEGSWLLWEAAQALDDAVLITRVHETTLKMAQVVFEEGIDRDGSLFQESSPRGITPIDKEWWTQAEGVVGFFNAFQLSGEEKFLKASERCWAFIQNKLVDRQYGDWIKRIHPDGSVNHESFKVGPWECPYHQTRLCLQMIERLEKQGDEGIK